MLEKVTNALKHIETQGSFTAKQTAIPENLHIEIKNIGALTFPLKPNVVQSIIKHARPAKFGWRDETRLDSEVRNVWEVPKNSVKIDKRRWNKTLNPILEKLKIQLGLSKQGKLKAELHNALVYETGQFFLPHQDSEKSDGMIATLVIVLPSPYRGGSLVIDHQGEKKRYPSTSTPADKLTFIAFYTDCHHEVRPVTDGYRVVLTYNLVLEGAQVAEISSAGNQSQQTLTQAISDYFEHTTEPKPTWAANRNHCKKFIYLLDHEYTPKGLSWRTLKNSDRLRAQALLDVAKTLDLEIYLSLADIQEIWNCEDSYDDWRYSRNRYWDDDEDDYEDDYGDGENVELIELIDETTIIRHWVDTTDKTVKLSDLHVYGDNICWTKATNDFQPFESEYEGWTGNAGNTMDRWYHRAAIIAWRQIDHYSVMLEFSPSKAMSEIFRLTRKKSTFPQAQQVIRRLIPHWSGLESGATSTAISNVLKISLNLDDAELAKSLIVPLGLSALHAERVNVLIQLEQAYGTQWCIDVIKEWVISPHYGKKPLLIENLPQIIKKFVANDPNQHQVLNNWMLSHQLKTLEQTHIGMETTYQPAQLREQAPTLMKEIQDLLYASMLSPSKSIHDEVLDHLMDHQTLYPVVELSKLLQHFYKEYQRTELAGWKLFQIV